MSAIEKQIRKIFTNAILKFASNYKTENKNIQLRFRANINDEQQIEPVYDLLNNYIFSEDLSFVDIAGLFNGAFQQLIEPYIVELFIDINKEHNIEVENIGILIQTPTNEFKYTDLRAFLYDGKKFIKEIAVGDFVKQETE